MALTTLGGHDVAERVAVTIQRRGADSTSMSNLWTSVAAAGGALAAVSMFVTWYADVRTATAWFSGFLPPIALMMIMAAAGLLVAKSLKLFKSEPRLDAELFSFLIVGGGALLMMLRQMTRGGLHNAVFLLLIPLGIFLYRTKGSLGRGAAKLEIEQVALGLATVGTGLIVLKHVLDPQYATGGWLWGLIAGLAVLGATLAACQYLGILSLFQVMLFSALAISVLILVVLITQVVGDGWPVLSSRFGDFMSGTLRSQSSDDQLGISQGIIGSFWIAVFVIVIAFPIGIAAAVYLEEYAPRDPITLRQAREDGGRGAFRRWAASRLTSSLDIIVRNLAGVPSVVYGLLGLFLFVQSVAVVNFLFGIVNVVAGGLHSLLSAIGIASGTYNDISIEAGQSTLFAGGVTLAILVLPIVVITAAEAIRAVPQSLREGAYGVGATKWEVIRSQVFPFAAPGILTGTLLALSRAVGEAAPLILVGAATGRLGRRDSMFDGFDEFFGQFADRFAAMPIIIVKWVRDAGVDEGFGPAAGAAIVMLLVFVVAMNSVAVLLRNYFEKKRA